MRICYLAPASDIHTQRWAKYFVEKGDEVYLISLEAPFENLENINLHLLKLLGVRTGVFKYAIQPLYVLRQLKKLIKEIKPDIVHGFPVETLTIVGGLTNFHPYIVSTWGSDVFIYPKESKLRKYTVPFTLRRADMITCDGANTEEAMIKMGIKGEKINRVLHGVDVRIFNPLCKDERLKEKLEISDSPTVINTRRLRPICDVETLVKAIPLVLREIPEAKFIIAGEGNQKDYLMGLAKSLNVFEAMRFIGWIPNDELPKYLSSCDVYVSTSLSDSGLSSGTAEAMACGLAVVITDFGDNRMWVEDGVNGYLIPLRSPETLASKVVHLLRNREVREEFGQVSQQIIEERNNWEVEMGKMRKIYEEQIERGKR